MAIEVTADNNLFLPAQLSIHSIMAKGEKRNKQYF